LTAGVDRPGRNALEPTGATPLNDFEMTQTSACDPPRRAHVRALVRAAIVLAALALAGCHRGILRGHACNKPQAYASAQSIPPLKVPPGIDAPDTHAALRIPDLNEPAPPPRSLREPCLDEPPPYAAPGESSRRRVPGA
jgi:hypothetical protein